MKTVQYAVCPVCQRSICHGAIRSGKEVFMRDHPPIYIKEENWVPHHDGTCEGSGQEPEKVYYSEN